MRIGSGLAALATVEEIARAEEEQRGAPERHRAVHEIGALEAHGRHEAREQRARRRPDLDPEREPAESGADGSVTPSSRTYRGRNGEKNWNPTNAMKTHRARAQTLRCQP
jgi:hypothetical protein